MDALAQSFKALFLAYPQTTVFGDGRVLYVFQQQKAYGYTYNHQNPDLHPPQGEKAWYTAWNAFMAQQNDVSCVQVQACSAGMILLQDEGPQGLVCFQDTPMVAISSPEPVAAEALPYFQKNLPDGRWTPEGNSAHERILWQHAWNTLPPRIAQKIQSLHGHNHLTVWRHGPLSAISVGKGLTQCVQAMQ